MLGSPKILEQGMVRAIADRLQEQPEFKEWLGGCRLCKEALCAITAGAMLEFFLARPDGGRDFLPLTKPSELDALAGVPGFGKALWLSGVVSRVQVPEEGVEVMRLNAWFGPDAHRLLTGLALVYGGRLPAVCVVSDSLAAQMASEGAHVTPLTPCVEAPEPTQAPPGPKERAAQFEEFWALYPKKTGKKAVASKYEALRTDKENPIGHEQIMSGLARALGSRQWHKDDGQFIPNPLTWLNQGRWDDEPEVQLGEVKKQSAQDGAAEQRRKREEEMQRRERIKGGDHRTNGEAHP